jgi:hypothetical protein
MAIEIQDETEFSRLNIWFFRASEWVVEGDISLPVDKIGPQNQRIPVRK